MIEKVLEKSSAKRTKLHEDKVLTKRQVAALLFGAYQMRSDPQHPTPWAFDALFLMYLLGLRIGEVIRLRYSHVGRRNKHGLICSIRVPTEKKVRFLRAVDGGHPKVERIDPLSALYEVPVLDLNEWLAKSFDSRTRNGAAALSEWLFPSPRNPERHISDRMIDYAFREARGRGGLPDVYSTHCLRHTSATEIARAISRSGAGDEEVEAWVGKFLRHSGKVNMQGRRVTRTYIHLGPRTLEEWAPMMRVGVLALPRPLAPVGPSRFDPERRFGRR